MSVVLGVLTPGGLALSPPTYRSIGDAIALPASLDPISSTTHFWSPDGRYLALAGESAVVVHVFAATDLTAPASTIAEPNVVAAFLSPAGRFCCTWRKPTSETDNNLSVWDLSAPSPSTPLVSTRRKRLERSAGSPVAFAADESSMWTMNGSELVGYVLTERIDGALQYTHRLQVADMVRFWLSPVCSPACRVLVLIAGRKGQPSTIAMHEVGPTFATVLSSKSFFQNDDVEVQWAPDGEAAIVKASAAQDKTGASYYGSASLYLLHADPNMTTSTVCSAATDGACADARWNPVASKREFALICGRRAWICSAANSSCALDLGKNAWNTVRWSPSGRYLVVGGFGNMNGAMWFFDRVEARLLGTGTDTGSRFFGWAPDSKSIVTASLFPTRRVDNGYTVFKYQSDVLAKHQFDKLLGVQFIALMPQSEFPDEPSTAKDLQRSKPIEMAASIQSKVASYRPPLARTSATAAPASSVTSLLRQMRDGPTAGAASAAVPVVNAAADAKKAARNQARRDRRSKKSTADALPDNAPPISVKVEDPAKVIKNLQKKLRQIEQLKESVRTSGAVLLPEQIEKLSKESSIIEQLRTLGIGN